MSGKEGMTYATNVDNLYSVNFERLLSDSVGIGMSRNISLLVRMSSMFRVDSKVFSFVGFNATDFMYLTSSFGSMVLRGLEAAVDNGYLKSLTVEQMKGLFLAILATIVAVGSYTAVRQGFEVGLIATSKLRTSRLKAKAVGPSIIDGGSKTALTRSCTPYGPNCRQNRSSGISGG